MKQQNEARQKQGKRKTQKATSDHMKECLTLSEVQATVSQYKKQEVSRTRWSHKRNVDTHEQFSNMTTAGHFIHCHVYGGRQSLYQYLLTRGTREIHTLPIRGEG